MAAESAVLSQSFGLGYTYTRSTGPVMGRFLTELRARSIIGIKGSDGRVIVPPVEYDPNTADALEEFVSVSNSGAVQTWCWVKAPREKHPLAKPFAWALIVLDGADTPMLHAVEVNSEADMRNGMRVTACWVEETQGLISDIRCFVPGDLAQESPTVHATSEKATGDEVTCDEATGDEEIAAVDSPIYLNYKYTAGHSTSRFLSAIKNGKIVGQRCPSCKNVFVPPRGSCAACGVATTEEVECGDKATVESFTIVHIPIPGNPIQPPFVVANLVVDGANISFIHLMSECDNSEVRIGQRVQAVWKPRDEWGNAMDNIRYFKPIDEPDVTVELIGKGKNKNA